MLNLIWKPHIALGILLSFSLSTVVPLRSVLAETPVATSTTSPFATARNELPTELYTLYRIVERIARTNGYDNQTWQVTIVPESQGNQLNRGTNSIVIPQNLLSRIPGDASALACVVAQQMGQHIQQYLPITEELRNEYIHQIRSEVENSLSSQQRRNSTGSVMRTVGGAIANRLLPGLVGDLVGGIISNPNHRRRDSQRQIEQTIETRIKELDKHLQQRGHQQQLAVDEFAYLASVRAGFERGGCLRAMEVLARFAPSDSNPFVPTISQRAIAIQALMEKNPNPLFTEEVKTRLTQSPPLTYQLSGDRRSLQINPRHGTSVVQDIDRLFGF